MPNSRKDLKALDKMCRDWLLDCLKKNKEKNSLVGLARACGIESYVTIVRYLEGKYKLPADNFIKLMVAAEAIQVGRNYLHIKMPINEEQRRALQSIADHEIRVWRRSALVMDEEPIERNRHGIKIGPGDIPS